MIKISVAALWICASAVAQDTSDEMLRAYLRGLAHEALDRRLETYEALKTPRQITVYQHRLRAFFREQLGEFPERTPLNPRVVGEKVYASYRIEKLIYESQPGFFVTALLYLPDAEGPHPAVLLPCGHTANGKAGYQEASVLLAKSGLATLCYDPIGQGERKQVREPEYPSTTEHMILSPAPILLGRNLATDMIWDGIRSIDYLASRPDIDASRIGVTGNSGGGMMTSYLMALDDRITAAAPGCFITTTRRKNESPGPGDAEQNIHGQIAAGLDHPDFILLRAPRPTLILSATRDFVPIEGAWESFRQAKRLYTRLGHPERIGLVETDAPHGFSRRLREGAAHWMRRWLLDSDEPVTEQAITTEPDEALQCTPTGQVLDLPGARSIHDLNRERARQLDERRKALWDKTPTEELRAHIREIAGIRPLNDLPAPRVDEHVGKLVLHTEPGIYLPALYAAPALPSTAPVLYLHGDGKRVDEQLVEAGHAVLALDLRGIGETRTTPWRYTSALEFTGSNPAEFFIAYMLGRSLTGMRAEDALVAARYLSERHKGKIHVIATGEAGPAALHAVALEPDLFSQLTLRESLTSWNEIIDAKVPRAALVHAIHGALETYDLTDLITLVKESGVEISALSLPPDVVRLGL